MTSSSLLIVFGMFSFWLETGKSLSLISVVSLAIFQSLQFDTAEAKKYKLIKSIGNQDLCWGVEPVKKDQVLRLVKRNREDEHQLWVWDGDDITPKEDDHLCVHAFVTIGSHIVVRDCMNTEKQKWEHDETVTIISRPILMISFVYLPRALNILLRTTS